MTQAPKPGWVATFMVLDVSGVMTSSQFHRLFAPFRNLYRKLLGG